MHHIVVYVRCAYTVQYTFYRNHLRLNENKAQSNERKHVFQVLIIFNYLKFMNIFPATWCTGVVHML